MNNLRKKCLMLANRTCPPRKQLFLVRQIQSSSSQCNTNSSSEDKGSPTSVLNSLEASSKWRKGQLTKITEKFASSADSKTSSSKPPEPMEITSDDEIQPMWKDMESRVVRRRSIVISEALQKGKKVGRRNVRKTDEEAWLNAGLYEDKS